MFSTVLARVDCLSSSVFAPRDVEGELASIELLVIVVEGTQKGRNLFFAHIFRCQFLFYLT